MKESAARLWERCGYGGLVLLAIVVAALALRLPGVLSGLPYNFVDPDEGTVVYHAFRVAHGHLDPGFFYYPSLFFYLLAGLYWLATPVFWATGHGNFLATGSFIVDQGPYLLLGRLLGVAFGVVSVYLVYRLGRVAFGRAAGLLAAAFLAVSPLHVGYSHAAVTDVPAAAWSLLALLLFLYAAQGRGRRWLIAGALAAGLATSTKYNLGLLLLPATVAAVYACRAEVPRGAGAGVAALRWARLLAGRVWLPMVAAFLAGSPFVLLDAPRFVHDFLRQNSIMDHGWLGFENVGNGFWYNVDVNLAGALGVVLVVLSVAGLVWALYRRTRFDLIVAPYAIVYFAYVSTWKELADRYLLPVVPLLLLLAARICVELLQRRPAIRRALGPAVAAMVAVAVVLPLSDSIANDHRLSLPDVRLRAKSWVERTIRPGSVVAVDTQGPPLVRQLEAQYYRAAGQKPVPYRLIQLKLPVPGQPDPWHDFAWLRAHHVAYVIVSSAVYGRVLAAASHYPPLVAFYRDLDQKAELLRVFRPTRSERGPVLKLYRLKVPSGHR